MNTLIPLVAQTGDALMQQAAGAAGGEAAGLGQLIQLLTIFVLAIFVGFEIITKVPPTLHTPLMSGSNAISGITIIGALVAAGYQQTTWTAILGFIAVTFAAINVVGGYMVTHRMLAMFRRKG
jgi:NAD(P) transhydrogenase subunit alpha